MKFDADFECANCDHVRRVSKSEYHVFMRSDSNGLGNLQWFAFRMKNVSFFTGKITIVICNFTKVSSLYTEVS